MAVRKRLRVLWALGLGLIGLSAGRAQDKAQECKPRLPPIRRVTLTLDQVPADRAIEQLQKAAGLPIYFSSGMKGEGMPLDPRPISVKLEQIPLMDALVRFCRAHGELWFTMENDGVVMETVGVQGDLPLSLGDLFAFTVGNIVEEVETDFADETRKFEMTLQMYWQPDLRIFHSAGVTLDEAVDDKGHDLRPPKPKPDTSSRPLGYERLSLVMPPPGATKIARLRGAFELDVPGDVVEYTFKELDKDKVGPIAFDDFKISATRNSLQDRTSWQIVIESAQKGGRVIGVTQPEIVRRDGSPAEGDKGVSFRTDDPAARLWFEGTPDAIESLRFKIVKRTARLRASFDFKDVPLPRGK